MRLQGHRAYESALPCATQDRITTEPLRGICRRTVFEAMAVADALGLVIPEA
jgi:hypothetical protein